VVVGSEVVVVITGVVVSEFDVVGSEVVVVIAGVVVSEVEVVGSEGGVVVGSDSEVESESLAVEVLSS
jgi:hypothetical protein